MDNAMNVNDQESRLRQSLGNASIGATVGRDVRSGQEVFQFNEDRCHHTVLIGRTGSGKSNHIQRLERDDIRNGAGCLIMTANEEDALYPLSCIPDERLGEVVFADFGNDRYLPVMNPLDVDVNDPTAVAEAIDSVLELLKIDSAHGWEGPRLEAFARMGIGLMLQPDYPYERDLGKMKSLFYDPDYLGKALDRCADTYLLERWRQEAGSHGDSAHEDAKQEFVARTIRFANDPVLRHVFTAGRSTIDIADVVNSGKVLIVCIPESTIGKTAASTVSRWIVMQLRAAVRQRDVADVSGGKKNYNLFAADDTTLESTPASFFVYIDDFGKFADTGFAKLFAESRRHRVALTISLQTLSQARTMDFFTGGEDLTEAIMGNVGSTICYSLNTNDIMTLFMDSDMGFRSLKGIEGYRPLARLCMNNRLCQPVTLEVDLRPDPDNPTAPNRVVARHIEEGIWTLASEGAAEVAERMRQQRERRSQPHRHVA